jgi:regulatory protein
MIASILDKIKRYCAYQERCHSEVQQKLFDLGCTSYEETGEYTAALIEENYLNEERFARAFARGKFRMKGWGRKRITMELKQRKVSDYCIKAGLTEIDDAEYLHVLHTQAEKKWAEYRREANDWKRTAKTRDALLRKGFEGELVNEALQQVKQIT